MGEEVHDTDARMCCVFGQKENMCCKPLRAYVFVHHVRPHNSLRRIKRTTRTRDGGLPNV